MSAKILTVCRVDVLCPARDLANVRPLLPRPVGENALGCPQAPVPLSQTESRAGNGQPPTEAMHRRPSSLQRLFGAAPKYEGNDLVTTFTAARAGKAASDPDWPVSSALPGRAPFIRSFFLSGSC